MAASLRTVSVTATGVVSTRRSRLVKLMFDATATAGQLVCKDGSTGPVLLDITTPDAKEFIQVDIPRKGVLFQNGINVDTLTNINAVTFFFEDE